MRFVRVLVLFAALPALCTRAQVFDLDNQHVTLTELSGQFRFHTGDSSAWADPHFDDSSWALLRSDQGWAGQGYESLSGLAWYRFQVIPAPGQKSLALLIPSIGSSYQVFANGELIGHEGSMPPQARARICGIRLMHVPDRLVHPGEPLVVAIRLWEWPPFAGSAMGGMRAAPWIGTPDAIAERRRFELQRIYWKDTDGNLLLLVNLVTAVLGLALFMLRRSEREYFWYGAAHVLWTASSLVGIVADLAGANYIAAAAVSIIASKGGAFLNLEFFLALLRKPRGIAYWIGATFVLLPIPLLWPAFGGWMNLGSFQFINGFSYLPYAIVVPLLLFRSGRERNMEARVLFIPFSISSAYMAISYLVSVFGWMRFAWVAAAIMGSQRLISRPFPVSFGNLIGVLCNVAVGSVLILRFARSRRDEERLAAELEAARAVQHVLIPDEIPAVPGFRVECVYNPAGQVGGDFFQILPQPDGNALIVIGDVSGKGMPAAMMVSLLVGGLRTAAESTSSPAALLASLNRRIIGRTAGGFTTCLILNVSPSGTVVAANAGHLSPYVNGTEVAVENGLPLGLDPGAAYAETSFELPPNGKLTLLTDGVVEARNAAGELFGFDRTRSIAGAPADTVAQTARAFGQEDDITVLRLLRETAEEPHAVRRSATAVG